MTSKTRLLALLLLCLGLMSASAEQAPSAQQLLDAAHKATDRSSAGPYILRADVVVNPNSPALERRGKLTIVRDHDRARFTLESNGKTQQRVVLGKKQFFSPEQGTLFGMGLKDFDYSWDPGRPEQFAVNENRSFGKVRAQKIQERDAWCFDENKRLSKTKLCFDKTTSVLLQEGSNAKSSKEYSDYASFGTSMYPRKVEVFRENLAPFELDQISIEQAELNDDFFKPPDNAVVVEVCDHEKPPEAISAPEPNFPRGAKDAGQEAVTVVSALINNEGRVVAAQALGSDPYGFGQITADAVRTWRFKPATCDGRPVATEMNIEMSFRLH
jgi:TonB family protein